VASQSQLYRFNDAPEKVNGYNPRRSNQRRKRGGIRNEELRRERLCKRTYGALGPGKNHSAPGRQGKLRDFGPPMVLSLEFQRIVRTTFRRGESANGTCQWIAKLDLDSESDMKWATGT
jgi:hypothetical protein